MPRCRRACASLQQLAARQRVDEQVIDYAVRIVRATRDYAGLAIGSGSRGALALVRGARAVALLDGRDYVTPDDVKRIALPALRHRVALAPDALLEGRTANDLLAEVIETVAAPRIVTECDAIATACRFAVIPARRPFVAIAALAVAVLVALLAGVPVALGTRAACGRRAASR